MQVEQGFSDNADPALAVAEATHSFRMVRDPDVNPRSAYGRRW